MIVSIVAAAAATMACPATYSELQDRQDLLVLEQRWNDAVVARDIGSLDQILADDFLLVWIDGSIIRKPRMLSSAAERRASIDPFKTEDVEVRLYGDTAILTGRFTQTARLGERSETNSFRYTDVYRREGCRWRAVSAHASLIR